MGRAQGIITKINKALTTLNATDRVIYKRVTTSVGGDTVTGRGSTVTVADTAFDPQPAIESPGDSPYVDRAAVLAVGGVVAQAGDYIGTFSATSLTHADLANKNISAVFKGYAVDEVMHIISFSTMALEGIAVAYRVLLRSEKR